MRFGFEIIIKSCSIDPFHKCVKRSVVKLVAIFPGKSPWNNANHFKKLLLILGYLPLKNVWRFTSDFSHKMTNYSACIKYNPLRNGNSSSLKCLSRKLYSLKRVYTVIRMNWYYYRWYPHKSQFIADLRVKKFFKSDSSCRSSAPLKKNIVIGTPCRCIDSWCLFLY